MVYLKIISFFIIFITQFDLYTLPVFSADKNPNKDIFSFVVGIPSMTIGEKDNNNDNYALWEPIQAYGDTKGNYYILDMKRNEVLKYDKNGKFLLKWGGSGSAPGEFHLNRVCFIYIDNSDKVYVADNLNRRVQIFDENGKYINCIAIGLEVTSLSVNSKGLIYITYILSSKKQHVVKTFQIDGKETGSFGIAPQPSIEPYYDPFLYISYILHDEDDDTYILFQRMPYIRKYDSQNRLLYEKKINVSISLLEKIDELWRSYPSSSTKPFMTTNETDERNIPFCWGAVMLNDRIYLRLNWKNDLLILNKGGDTIGHMSILPGVAKKYGNFMSVGVSKVANQLLFTKQCLLIFDTN